MKDFFRGRVLSYYNRYIMNGSHLIRTFSINKEDLHILRDIINFQLEPIINEENNSEYPDLEDFGYILEQLPNQQYDGSQESE